MKKIISFILILMLSVTLLAGCSDISDQIKFCSVSFYVDGELYDTKTVSLGQTVSAPTAPEKENMIFTGWQTDGLIASAYDFSSAVLSNLKLNATFTPDIVKIGNMIARQTLSATVKISNESYNTVSGTLITTGISTAQGSGVVVDISNGKCYVLTNAHVVELADGYSKQSLTVEDPWGNSYSAYIYKNSSKGVYAVDERYDLALIYFEYKSANEDNVLSEMAFGEDPKQGDFVIAIGNPENLSNAVTYGSAVQYQRVNAEEGSAAEKIEFDTLIHNAPINHGSSGGALVDAYGKLVGINFAGYEDGSFGCAIPISKVIEFMNLYVYNK